ncbi:MAG: tetratricopeptide repeat protein [Burkholderiales bacterium]|nr:tetratricopeptide repeat protein [Burkholderiales bacterium]
MSIKIRQATLWALMIAGGLNALADDEASLTQAESLLRSDDGIAALRLLQPLEAAHAGEDRFDYLLGTALLLAGQPEQASLALERAIAVNPNHAAAHMELGRAYFMMGSDDLASQEFDTALRLAPPAPARSIIARYQAQIAERRRQARIHASAHADLALGYDSNINNAASLTQIAIPALNNLSVSLNPANVATHDGYRSGGFGGTIDVPINDALHWSTTGNLQHRDNLRKPGFDLASQDASTGLAYTQGAQTFQANLIGGRVYLSGPLNRRFDGLSGEWHGKFWDDTQLVSVTQYVRYRFPSPELRSESFNQFAESAGVIHTFAGQRGVWATNLLLAWEHDTDQRVDGKKHAYGLDSMVSWSFDEHDVGYLHGTWLGNRYGNTNAIFLQQRRDDYLNLVIGGVHTFTPNLSLRPEATWTQNHSNLPVYGYHEAVFALNLRYNF